LRKLDCTLAISTFQAGKVIFISPKDDEHLVQLPRTFRQPMGIAYTEPGLAIATKDEVIVLANSPELATHYPNQPQTYDALFMPRATYYTGHVDIHDLVWGGDGLLAVNTSFSCICRINDRFSFEPIWQPNFIDKLASEDRCHLNGMVLNQGRPKYATALGMTNAVQGWKVNIPGGGILVDVPSNEILLADLLMPHSPRLVGDDLYLLLSATGELAIAYPTEGRLEVVRQLEGFVRGMAIHKDYAFVGTSRLRRNSSSFGKLPISEKAVHCGIEIVHLPTAAWVGRIRYEASVDEIYDVQVLPGLRRPGIVNTEGETHKLGLSIPGATYWAAAAPDPANS
jgi:uncharacterized protein (TIGR03032 family)